MPIPSALKTQRHKDHCSFDASQRNIAGPYLGVQSARKTVQKLRALTIFEEDLIQLGTHMEHTRVAHNHL